MEDVHWSAGFGLAHDVETGQYYSLGQAHLPFGREDLYDESGEKRIGRRFMFMHPRQTVAMLHGLIETDGGIYRGDEVYFYNSSVQLAEGFRFQLLRLGIPSAGQLRTRQTPFGESTGYDIRVPAVPIIADELGVPAIQKRNWLEWQGCVWTAGEERRTS